AHVRHNEADAGIKFSGMPLDLGDNPPRLACHPDSDQYQNAGDQDQKAGEKRGPIHRLLPPVCCCETASVGTSKMMVVSSMVGRPSIICARLPATLPCPNLLPPHASPPARLGSSS